VRNWIDRGELPALHAGRRVRVRRSDFDQFLEHGHTGVPRQLSEQSPTQAFWEGELSSTPLQGVDGD
jgi:Helix-turn-helix domain